MESKLNQEALEEYSRGYSSRLLDSFFEHHNEATGQDILSFSSLKQINLFVIYRLLNSWRAQMDDLKSPYFDFNRKEVKTALQEFGNVLSQHILMTREQLSPLLENAVSDTLLLILSPYDFYCSQISNWGKSEINTGDLHSFAKYVKINHSLVSAFIKRLENEKTTKVSIEDALKILNEVFENTSQSPEDVEPFLSDFSAILPMDLNLVYREETETGGSAKQKDSVATLNDQLAGKVGKSGKDDHTLLADLRKKKNAESIKSQLSINQKFMFVNQLFDGNVDDFNKVLDFLDSCQSQAEAMDFINSNYLKKSNWKKDSTEVKEFIEVIARKYT